MLLPVGRGLVGLRLVPVWCTCRSTLWAGRWVCPLSGVTFEPGHLLPWAWQEVKGEAASVNEADYRR